MTIAESGRKVAFLLRLFTFTQHRVEWLLWKDKCAWRKSSYRNTQNFIGKPPSCLQVDWDMKTSEMQVERQGASLPEGQSTHDNPSASFICFILYALPLGCLPDEVNTLVPWLSEINLTEDFCAGPFGAARLWGLEDYSSCPSLDDKLVINCETTASSRTRVFVTLLCCSSGSIPELGRCLDESCSCERL